MYLYLITSSGLMNKIVIILHTNTTSPILAEHYTKTCTLYHNNYIINIALNAENIYGEYITKCQARRKFIFYIKKISKNVQKFQHHHHVAKQI